MHDDTPQWRVLTKGYSSSFLHLGISWVKEGEELSILFGFGLFYIMFKKDSPSSRFMM